MTRGAQSTRRGAVLLGVMLIITIAALVGTSVLYVADAQRGSASLTLEQAQLRALAWSGVQGAMAELASQRDALMRGEAPNLTSQWTLFEGSTSGDIRLATLAGGGTAQSESAKLDLNTATAPMLARLPGLNDSLAGRVLGARGREFGSPEELARVEGLPASILLDVGGDAAADQSQSPLGLLALTTTFSFDPNTAPDGEPRVNLSGGWSDEVKADLTARFPEVSKLLEPFIEKAGKLTDDSVLVGTLARNQVPQGQWDDVLAVVTTTDEQFNRGRVDINRAPVEVLAAIPGLDRPSAEKIIDARARTSAADREKPTWPLAQGALTPEQFQKAVPWVTTRSLQWRVRVEARLQRALTSEKPLGSTLRDDSDALGPPGMVWEAVIDVSDTRPRVAYLRDVTHLPALARQALANEQAQEASTASAADDGAGAPGVSDVPPLVARPKKKSNADLDLGTMKRDTLELDSGLNLGSSSNGTQPGGRADAQSDKSTGQAGGSPPPASKDRRIGRWRGRKE